jgi:hypothetical protein
MADDSKIPHLGGTLDDATRPDGYGSPSNDQPVLPSRQPVPTPRDVTPRKKVACHEVQEARRVSHSLALSRRSLAW